MSQIVRARPGTAALLVCMATSGAVLAYSSRDGELLRGFRLLGRFLLEGRTVPRGFASLLTIPITTPAVGALHHVVVAFLWGLVLGLTVRPFRGVAFVVAALAVAVTFSLLNLWLIPPMFGVGFGTVTSVARAIPFGLAIAAALLVTPWASGVGGRPTSF